MDNHILKKNPRAKKVAEVFNVEPQRLLGTDDSDILIWHYGRLEGATINVDKGLQQALVQGRDKSFIYPILRKYYSKGEMQDLVDSYDLAGNTVKKTWPQDKVRKESTDEKKETVTKNCVSIQINLVPPESLFEGASTEEKTAFENVFFKPKRNRENYKPIIFASALLRLYKYCGKTPWRKNNHEIQDNETGKPAEP